MPSVRFAVEFAPLEGEPGFDSTGADQIRFLMSANAGEELGRISRIASGGELSRIMLAMKNVFAEHDPVATMIFDEIDTGVSGIAAQRVGEKLYSVSRGKQVMCVTHLPQIAAMADSHYLIAKEERNGRTYTDVTKLDREGQRMELARLHGGDNITITTLASAEEQLEAAERFKKAKLLDRELKKSLYNARVNARKNRSSALFPAKRAPGRWKGERGAREVPFGAAGLKPAKVGRP